MNMIWTPLRHRVWIVGGLAFLALGTIPVVITASRLQAQQDLAFEAQKAADAERAGAAVAKTIAEMRQKSAASLDRRRMRQDASDRLGNSSADERSMLIQQYAKAKQDKHVESQHELRERLIALTRQEFQAIEKTRKVEIQVIEERLEKLKAVMEERAEKSELIIDLRVKRLLGEPTILDWNDPTNLPALFSNSTLGSLGVEDGAEVAETMLNEYPVDNEYSVYEAMEGNDVLLNEAEEADLKVETEDAISRSVERIKELMEDKAGELGTLGVGMAGVYSMQNDVEQEWKQANDQREKLVAEVENLDSALRDLNSKSIKPPEEFIERRKELLAQYRAFEEQYKKLRAGRENWERRVQQGEATLRQMQSEIDVLKGKLEHLRAKKKQQTDMPN